MPRSKVFIRSTASKSIDEVVADVMDNCGWAEIVPEGARVVVKPNLCTPSIEIIEMANTSPQVLAAVCKVLSRRTKNVVIGESDGVRYSAEEAFEMSGTYKIAEEFGFEVKSFTKDELVEVGHPHLRGWPLPKTILECDVFMTVAKVKTHATTTYTGALKNQWGCVPQHDRLILHKNLHTLIPELNRMFKTRLAIIDGLVAMEGRGPINGKPVQLNVVAGGTDIVSVDSACMRFVGLDPMTSAHIVNAAAIGLGNIRAEDIDLDTDCQAIKQFLPAEQDWPIRAMNLITKSEFLTRNLLLNDRVFFPARWVANFSRRTKARLTGGAGQDYRTG